MFYDDDIDVFFNDFAQTVTYNGASIKAVSTPAGTLQTYGTIAYITTEHELIVKSTDCPSIKKSDVVVVGGISYHPVQPQPDGTGITKMTLAVNVR